MRWGKLVEALVMRRPINAYVLLLEGAAEQARMARELEMLDGTEFAELYGVTCLGHQRVHEQARKRFYRDGGASEGSHPAV